jgi:hypothetical protein
LAAATGSSTMGIFLEARSRMTHRANNTMAPKNAAGIAQLARAAQFASAMTHQGPPKL